MHRAVNLKKKTKIDTFKTFAERWKEFDYEYNIFLTLLAGMTIQRIKSNKSCAKERLLRRLTYFRKEF